MKNDSHHSSLLHKIENKRKTRERERMIAEEKMNRPIRVAFIIGACKLVRNMPRRIDGTPFAHKRKKKNTFIHTLSLALSTVKILHNLTICEKMPRVRHANERN